MGRREIEEEDGSSPSSPDDFRFDQGFSFLLLVLCPSIFQTPFLLQRASQQPFDLPVETTQFVIGPALKRIHDAGVNPYQEWFTVGHWINDTTFLCLEQAGFRAHCRAPPGDC